MTPNDVLTFWFKESTPAQWFKKDEAFDRTIRERFLKTYESISRGETEDWLLTPEGRLAEILVLDQFSRNMFRDSPQAFKEDERALALAKEAVRVGDDMRVPVERRHFFYMPYMHSESAKVHEEAVQLFEALGNEEALKYELEHKAIIERFGRYPHRNEVLGRTSTPEELEFLKEHSGF